MLLAMAMACACIVKADLPNGDSTTQTHQEWSCLECLFVSVRQSKPPGDYCFVEK